MLQFEHELFVRAVGIGRADEGCGGASVVGVLHALCVGIDGAAAVVAGAVGGVPTL